MIWMRSGGAERNPGKQRSSLRHTEVGAEDQACFGASTKFLGLAHIERFEHIWTSQRSLTHLCLYLYMIIYIYIYYMFIHVNLCLSNLSISMLWALCAASRRLWGGSEKLSRAPAMACHGHHGHRGHRGHRHGDELRTSSSPSMAVPRSWDATFARTELWPLISYLINFWYRHWCVLADVGRCWQGVLAGCFASAGHVPALPWWVSLTCLQRRITGKHQSLNSFEASNLHWIFAGITVLSLRPNNFYFLCLFLQIVTFQKPQDGRLGAKIFLVHGDLFCQVHRAIRESRGAKWSCGRFKRKMWLLNPF